MKLSDLERLIVSHAPGSLIPRDWLLEQLQDVDAEHLTSDPLVDLSVEAAGEILGRSHSTIREYCRRKLLPGAYRQRGREWRIPRQAILAFQRGEAEKERPKPVRRSTRTEEIDLGAWRKEVA